MRLSVPAWLNRIESRHHSNILSSPFTVSKNTAEKVLAILCACNELNSNPIMM